MKLKDLLYENNKDRLARHLTKEAKQDIIKSVSAFNEFGSNIYRTQEIKEMVEAIVKMSEGATQLALQETDDWFDSVTVKRDMNEVTNSVKLFEKTARELSALQQRLESVYEDMGHKLGKYYEISEGNAFGAERAKAIASDEDEFTVDGEKFPVKSVDKDDEENAEEFTEAVNEVVKPIKLSGNLKKDLNTVTAMAVKMVDYAKDNFNTYIPTGEKLSQLKLGGTRETDVLKYNIDHLAKAINTDLKKKYMKDFMGEGFTQSTKLDSILKEGSGTWKVKFAKSNVNGVAFGGVSKVIARTPAEAIKKAVKVVQAKAGFKGGNNDWMAVDVDSVSKA
jgi:coenzyme F420-reducing hydrogenase delta subunit